MSLEIFSSKLSIRAASSALTFLCRACSLVIWVVYFPKSRMALVTVGNRAFDVVDVRGYDVQPIIDYLEAPSCLFPEIEHILSEAVDLGIEAANGPFDLGIEAGQLDCFETLTQALNIRVDAVEPFVLGHPSPNLTSNFISPAILCWSVSGSRSPFPSQDGIFDADAAEAFEVDAWLDGDRHARLETAFIALAEARGLVDLESRPWPVE